MVDQEKLDNLMLELDGTENKCKQGLEESGEAEGGDVWSRQRSEGASAVGAS